MSKPVVVTIPHQLGRQGAKNRLTTGLADARTQLSGKFASIEETWTDDRLDFRLVAMGQTVAGRIDVYEDSVRVEVDLPWMLAALANKVTGRIEKQGALMLEKK